MGCMDDESHARSKGSSTRVELLTILTLAATIAVAPLARAESFYLARAIGEPAPPVREPAASSPLRDTQPELPGLGTEPRAQDSSVTTESSSTWKWVVGIAVTAAVVALAKGGGKGDSGEPAPSSGGTTGGGSGGGSSGGGSGGGGSLPSLPRLPGHDD